MSEHLDLTAFPHVNVVERALRDKAPYLAGVIQKQINEFGTSWLSEFDRELNAFFGNDAPRLANAVRGYIKFALDGMLLQKRFDNAGRYEPKTYDEAAQEVYQNPDYMFNLYLPGIQLSHFLWRHHYLQHIFFVQRFLPLIVGHGGSKFYDVGVGTGFYSKEMLRLVPNLRGEGFDLSEFSLTYARRMVESSGLADRYTCGIRDVTASPAIVPAPFIINVEVLEHLEDPLLFLKALNSLLEPRGYGMITAAVTAPNADHIYLYNSADEVVAQIEEAGFRVVDYREDRAYELTKPSESVPKNAAVIVTK